MNIAISVSQTALAGSLYGQDKAGLERINGLARDLSWICRSFAGQPRTTPNAQEPIDPNTPALPGPMAGFGATHCLFCISFGFNDLGIEAPQSLTSLQALATTKSPWVVARTVPPFVRGHYWPIGQRAPPLFFG